jgi:hypothetical protein
VEGGSVVADIWDDAQDYRAFFESAVKPNISAGARFEVRVIGLHNTIGL